MIPVKNQFSTEAEREASRKRNIMFNTHVCLPAIVQNYDPEKRIVDVQPTIRERYVGENGAIQYVAYPLLINVPVVFPSAGDYIISLPISKGDECLVIFSDLAIDNWWLYGNVQNPVEQRRHDLSDGMAIFGIKSQAKLSNEQHSPNSNVLSLWNTKGNTGIKIDQDGVVLCYWEKVDDLPTWTYQEQRFGDVGHPVDE